MKTIIRYTSISELHESLGIHKPEHPLISLINVKDVKEKKCKANKDLVFGFHMIIGITGELKEEYPYRLRFVHANQDMSLTKLLLIEKGWILLVHPSLMDNTNIGRHFEEFVSNNATIRAGISLEETQLNTIDALITSIQDEYENTIDDYTSDLILGKLQVMLNHLRRFISQSHNKNKEEI